MSFVVDLMGIDGPNAKSISATVEILPTTEFWLLFFHSGCGVSPHTLSVCPCVCVLVSVQVVFCFFFLVFSSSLFSFDVTHRERMSLTICSVIFCF